MADIVITEEPADSDDVRNFDMDFDVDTPRPGVWLDSALEWLVIGSAWAWLVLLAWHDRSQNAISPSA